MVERGPGHATVVGMVIGTGIGAGVCHAGRLVEGRNGLPGEMGHIGDSGPHGNALNVPILPCSAAGRRATRLSLRARA